VFLEYLPAFVAVLGIATTVLGWFARELWDAVKSLKKELNDHQVHVSEHYVKYDRLKDIMQPVMAALEEIKTTLKTKMDKQ